MKRKLTTTLPTIILLAITYSILAVSIEAKWRMLLMPLAILFAFVFAIDHSRQHLGWGNTLSLFGLTFAVSLLFESLGVSSGWVYGGYSYTEHLGYKFLGLVPVIIPIAWFMVAYPSLIMAMRLVSPRANPIAWRIQAAALGALIMTSWDLVLDPLMVASEHWIWNSPGAYFGIPLQNFLGWWLTVFFAQFAFLSFSGFVPAALPATERFFERQAILVYAILGLGTVAAAIQSDLAGPALSGFFAMTPWVLLAWREPVA